ncbi:DUF397 domain-containing protein [Streptomyces sp. NPDC059874]|uniref:DUF397 domain-containing protein n=1 Tax=Streptomyces sp. NPDC059874 TaxID=3346983 RepID=UPI003656CFC5
MSAPDLKFRKSSFSGGTNDNCVEVCDELPTVFVEDSKDRAAGRLSASRPAWAAFVGFAKTRDV